MACFETGPEIVVAALVYLDRFLAKTELKLTETNAKSLLHSALSLAAKFHVDRFEKNTIFYAVGGLSKRQMRNMLDTFLAVLEFRMHIEEEEFNGYMSKLKKVIAKKYYHTGQIVVLEKNFNKMKATNLTYNDKMPSSQNSYDLQLSVEGGNLKKQMT